MLFGLKPVREAIDLSVLMTLNGARNVVISMRNRHCHLHDSISQPWVVSLPWHRRPPRPASAMYEVKRHPAPFPARDQARHLSRPSTRWSDVLLHSLALEPESGLARMHHGVNTSRQYVLRFQTREDSGPQHLWWFPLWQSARPYDHYLH
jgi:hypothetical protein